MKIRFSNLGTIRETEIDLRPLTVIVGPNNSSKTYLAYSIYGLWQELHKLEPEVFEPLRTVRFDRTAGSLEWSIKRLSSAFDAHVAASTRRFEQGLGGFFQDSSDKLFRKTRFDVEVGSAAEILLSSMAGQRTVVGSGAGQRLWISIDDGDMAAIVGTAEDLSGSRKLPKGSAEVFLEDEMRDAIGLAFPAPFILPAERNALIITYKILSNRRFKLLRDAARLRKVGRRASDELHDALREQPRPWTATSRPSHTTTAPSCSLTSAARYSSKGSRTVTSRFARRVRSRVSSSSWRRESCRLVSTTGSSANVEFQVSPAST